MNIEIKHCNTLNTLFTLINILQSFQVACTTDSYSNKLMKG